MSQLLTANYYRIRLSNNQTHSIITIDIAHKIQETTKINMEIKLHEKQQKYMFYYLWVIISSEP